LAALQPPGLAQLENWAGIRTAEAVGIATLGSILRTSLRQQADRLVFDSILWSAADRGSPNSKRRIHQRNMAQYSDHVETRAAGDRGIRVGDGPYLLWDGAALYEDVWQWSNGQGETGYQIWGWGASNFVLGLGLVPDRFATWPFWLPELLVAIPLLFWFTYRQVRSNTLSNACWHYGVFLLAFLYVSRFLNENYLGYGLAFLALGLLTQQTSQERDEQATGHQLSTHHPQ